MKLLRNNFSSHYTEGRLYLKNGKVLYTLERPWLPAVEHYGGERFISCVPNGAYHLELHARPSGDTLILFAPYLNVFHDAESAAQTNGRYLILIHAGNTVDDSQGCILVGTEREPGRVMNSRNAMKTLLANAAGYITINSFRTQEYTAPIKTQEESEEKPVIK